jgi:murein DD-endopeptidase MepM/ murein hydrolase activator NlpD
MLKIKTDPISQLVDELPESSVTTHMLKALDYVVPGKWQNLTGFDNTIRVVTGESSPERVKAIREHALKLYQDEKEGYQKAVWLYQTVDTTDRALAAAALANKVANKIGFLSFLNKLTPKSDTVQSIDLGLKLVVEMTAFTLVNGLPRDGVRQFAQSLKNYGDENAMRMATLVCVDGVIPLGPDFVSKAAAVFEKADEADLTKNASYQKVSGLLPGDNPAEQLSYIKRTFASAQDWMSDLQNKYSLTPSNLAGKLGSAMEIADSKLDYLGAFLDATTSYYQHTGTQSIARSLILRSADEVALIEAKREQEEARKRQQEAEERRAKAEAERTKAEEERKRAEEERKQAVAAKAKSDEERKQKEMEEAKRQADEARLKAEEAQRQAEEAQRMATEAQKREAEALRRREEEAAAAAEVERTYVVKKGDSLSKIAMQFYGSYDRWNDIYEANKDQIKNPDLIYPDQEFVIPD